MVTRLRSRLGGDHNARQKPYRVSAWLGLAAVAGLSMFNWQMNRDRKPGPLFGEQSSHFHGPHGTGEHVEEGLMPHGPHGGLLFADRDLAIELVLQEHQGDRWLYAYLFTDTQRPLPPAAVQVIMAFRNNGISETVRLTADKNNGVALAAALPEDVLKDWQLTMLAQHGQHAHEWQLRNFAQMQ